MDEKTSLGELKTHLSDLETRLKDLAAAFVDKDFTDEAEAEWEALKTEISLTKDKITKREKREQDILGLSGDPSNTETEPTSQPFAFQTRRPGARVPDDPTQLEHYRNLSNNIDDLEQAYRDGACKIIQDRYRSAVPGTNREDCQADAERLVNLDREVAMRMITTSTTKYQKEFETFIRTQGRVIGPEMERTASLTTTAGGFAVPVELDTTLLLTNAGVINPIRALARVRQTNVNTVEFINTSGIVAGFGAEATEASDNAPVLAQPTVNIEKAFAFVPASIEIVEDWAGFQQDMAMCFADAKVQLESLKFLTGLGHAQHEPQGLIAVGGATAVTSTATTAIFAVADLFNLELQLSPRYRANASIVGNKATFQKVRQFASNGVNIWVQLQGGLPPDLIGYPAYEWSSYSSGVTTSGSTIVTIGDFNYFAIVDRVGMNVEFIPHLFGGSNRYPTGQRGLYAYWRTSSQVLSPSLGANSAFQSLKVL